MWVMPMVLAAIVAAVFADAGGAGDWPERAMDAVRATAANSGRRMVFSTTRDGTPGGTDLHPNPGQLRPVRGKKARVRRASGVHSSYPVKLPGAIFFRAKDAVGAHKGCEGVRSDERI